MWNLKVDILSCLQWSFEPVHLRYIRRSEWKMSNKYLTSAERNRLAKLKFLNENKERNNFQRGSSFRRSLPTPAKIEKIDISIPGTPVSSKYISQLKENQNRIECNDTNEYVDPFEVFLSSMKKLNSGELKQSDGKDILEMFVKLEKVVEKKEFGYNNIGILNGESNLKVHPAVRRSLSRRQSLQEDTNNNFS